jgi:hypothetical protein
VHAKFINEMPQRSSFKLRELWLTIHCISEYTYGNVCAAPAECMPAVIEERRSAGLWYCVYVPALFVTKALCAFEAILTNAWDFQLTKAIAIFRRNSHVRSHER